ncbi:hypothetical protein CBF34_07040 [Vagococcus penaei]|uniref:Gp15 family bacteriophage protein n=1 Tax=Vagococcus penaei TaxID=633807 RepID=UPI000F878AC6|nr:Gp15 family bacteriophage protein [Vagococcus penaei]RSU01408.1 hypothetical protein CBF34_07040 [Vagococcus penaei]
MLDLAWGIDSTINVDGLVIELDLEFSNVLRWFRILEDKAETDEYKVMSCLTTIACLSTEEISELDYDMLHTIFSEVLSRLIPQKKEDVTRDLAGNVISEPETKNYDLFEDSGYIYASFMHQYQIDLVDTSLHWDKFNAMLDGLAEDTRFREVLKIRQMEIPKKASQEEKEAMIKAKKSVALRSNREAMEFEAMDLKQKREWFERHNSKVGE